MADGEAREVALVTGCSSGGIGHALAMELAVRGFLVVATSRSLSSISFPSSHDSLHIDSMALDVSSLASISSTVHSIVQKYGRIDILINNAGVPCNSPAAETPPPLLESTFRTNLFGPIALIQAVVPHMVKAKKGKIVNVGSIGGFAAGPWSGVYSASKAALHAITDSLRVELKPFGIKVILVAPGGVVSNIPKRSVDVIQNLEFQVYKPFQKMINERAKYAQSPHSIPTKIFAKRTVDVLLKANPPRCFVYGYLSMTYSALYYMPLCIRDWYFSRKWGLSKPLSIGTTKKEI